MPQRLGGLGGEVLAGERAAQPHHSQQHHQSAHSKDIAPVSALNAYVNEAGHDHRDDDLENGLHQLKDGTQYHLFFVVLEKTRQSEQSISLPSLGYTAAGGPPLSAFYSIARQELYEKYFKYMAAIYFLYSLRYTGGIGEVSLRLARLEQERDKEMEIKQLEYFQPLW